ncbi:MAG: sodium/proton-translocating pyrophosphatase, partial [Bacillota bacterium]|nr:sodium/proton-translocating pyrophosphatase [Bacillota bacterium]
MNESFWKAASILVSALSLGVAFWLYTWVKAQPSSNKEIMRVGDLIKKGANTFLRREYGLLARFAGAVCLLILLFLPQPIWNGYWVSNLSMVFAYICGTLLSALAGKIGIQVATIANVKSAEASAKGITPSFMAGFRGGAVMGMAVVGLSLLGVTLVLVFTEDPSIVL